MPDDKGNSFAQGNSAYNGPHDPRPGMQWYAPPPVSCYTLTEGHDYR